MRRKTTQCQDLDMCSKACSIWDLQAHHMPDFSALLVAVAAERWTVCQAANECWTLQISIPLTEAAVLL